jgi:hypothetical protein
MKYILLVTGLFFLAGCNKYPEGPATLGGGAPAYLRVFNVVPFALTPFNSAGATPFFTFLFDPKMDGNGVPSGGYIVGDFLGIRQLYCTSYSINEGNSLNASLDTSVTTSINYEYPGEAHVLTAPPINGFDLSAWAQVPSGKHRVLFISRPQTDTAFANLSATIRKTVVIDTTIDLQAGEVYTLEAVARNLDSNTYGAYLRQEQFIHQSFSDSNMYVGVFNLSGAPSALNPAAVGSLPDTMNVSCIYNFEDDISSQASASGTNPIISYIPVPGFNNKLLMTVSQRLSQTTQYVPLPILPNSYYFDEQGIFRQYYGFGGIPGSEGTLPYVSLIFSDANPASAATSGGPIALNCNFDPALINNVQPYTLNGATDFGIGTNNRYTASLSLFSNFTGSIRAYPCLDIMEVVYNTVYFMRIQPAFYNPSN